MSTPTPRPAGQPINGLGDDDEQIRAWLRLKNEMSELHARLEYLKLMLTLGVRR